MQAVMGSSSGQVPCVKWTRGLGQMVFDGLGGCGGWAAYVVYGMWHSATAFGTYRRERSCALCGADHVVSGYLARHCCHDGDRGGEFALWRY
jgi:hypothetical protein